MPQPNKSPRNKVLGVLANFVYVGAEVTLGGFMINHITAADIGRHRHRASA